MTRPAVIIGLGGTGQQVVLSLKKDLLEIGKGELPKEVRLLAFDSAGRIAPQEGVELEHDIEYFQIGAPLYELIKSIRDDKVNAANGAQAQLSHLHWFPAEAAVLLGGAALNTSIGCGAYRPLGRLSLFNKVGPVVEKIKGAISVAGETAYGSRSDAENANLLEILVVSSLAGGTGAGALVDIGWLVRHIAEHMLYDKYVLRGFFVLPSGFGAGDARDVRSKEGRGFAAWRELDRALLGGGRNKIVYEPADASLNVSTDSKCYDVSYLLDPRRETYPLQAEPEVGIFPAIAHGMSLMLDKKSGNNFTFFWSNVFMNLMAENPGVYHSAFGCYTLKVPVYATEALFAQSLAIDTLDALLKPRYAEGIFAGLEENQNLERPAGWSAGAAVKEFLTQVQLITSGGPILNTPWLRIIGKLEDFTEAQRAVHIRALANSALSGQMSIYFSAFSQIPNVGAAAGAAAVPVMQQLTKELQWAVWTVAVPSREFGDTPQQAFVRLTNTNSANSVPMVFARRFGDETQYGTGGGGHGEFGAEMQRVKLAQLGAFRSLLREQMLVDLNGTVGDAVTAKTGKLGYVRAFCEVLSAKLDGFGTFLKAVMEMRSAELQRAANTQNAVRRAQSEYDGLRGETCVFTWWDSQVHPEAHRAQRRYLKAAQVDMDRRRGDIFLIVMAQTVAEMKTVVDVTLKDLNNWIAHLAYGERGFNIQGLRARLGVSKEDIVANQYKYDLLGNPHFAANRTFGGVAQAIAKREFVPAPAMVAELLGAFRWTASVEPGIVRLGFAVDYPGATPTAARIPHALLREGEKCAAINEASIVALSRDQYTKLVDQVSQPLAREVGNLFSAEELAVAMQNHAGVYYRQRPGGIAQQPLSRAVFLRVNLQASPGRAAYFNEFFGHYRQLHTGVPSARMYESEDQYKMTMMHVYDLIQSESFEMWHTCRSSYSEVLNLLSENAVHIFPAEQNAAYYERRLPNDLQTNVREFQPEVTALLESRERLSLFFRAFATGYIAYRNETIDGVFNQFWGYQLSGGPMVHLTNLQPGNDDTNVFGLVKAFLHGRDVRHDRQEVVGIGWPALPRALVLFEQDPQMQARSRYEEQMRGKSAGLVARIRSGGAMDAQNNAGAIAVKQQYLDLADVAELILKDACGALRA